MAERWDTGEATQGTETAGICPSPGPLGTSFPQVFQGDLHPFGRVLETGQELSQHGIR